MKIINLEIENFRGIKSSKIDFSQETKILCIIGPGDSTKSTLLKALEWLTWPSYNLSVNDADFYEGDAESDIVIRGTFSGFPNEFLDENKYGLMLRRPGIKYDSYTNDEPTKYAPQCITIQLTIDSNLEPKWGVAEIYRLEYHPTRYIYIHNAQRCKRNHPQGARQLNGKHPRHNKRIWRGTIRQLKQSDYHTGKISFIYGGPIQRLCTAITTWNWHPTINFYGAQYRCICK